MAEQPASRRSTRFSMRSKQLGQLLQESGDVKAEHIAKALKLQEQKGGLIGQLLRSMGVCEPQAVAAALLKQVQVTDIHCEDLIAPPEVLPLVSREICEADKLCPFEMLGNLLCVVMGNPLNRRAINAIEEATRIKVKPFKAAWPRIKELIDRSYAQEAPPSGAGDATPGLASLESLDAAPPTEIPVALEPEAAEPEVQAEQPLIEGLDSLNDGSAEVIETDGRGLRRRAEAVVSDEPEQPKAVRVAKVNVNLDELDLGQATEVVGTEEEQEAEKGEEEQLEEITSGSAAAQAKPKKSTPPVPSPAPVSASKLAPPTEALPTFELVPDAYFYSEGEAPEEGAERSDEFLALLETLPVAKVIAESVADFKRAQAKPAFVEAPQAAKAKSSPPPEKPAKKEIPIEYKSAPLEPVAALALSESEFQALVEDLGADPVGEWDWQYAAQGPVPVLVYEAEGA